MISGLNNERPQHLRQIQLITANSSEGVILIDVNQEIKWANAAALSMHAVQSYSALGRTIDEYHANFRVKFRGSQANVSEECLESVACGESFRDVIIEVTPLQGDAPPWTYRVRNLVMVDDNASPTCVVLVIRPLDSKPGGKDHFTATTEAMLNPAAILRVHDLRFVDANAGFLQMMGIEKSSLCDLTLSGANFVAGAEDAEKLHEQIANASPVGFVNPVLARADGQVYPVRVAGAPVIFERHRCMLFTFSDAGAGAYAAGGVPGFGGNTANITALCAMATTPMHVLDADMRILGVSDTWLEWLSYARKDVVGRPIADFMTPGAAEHFEHHTWHTLGQSGATRDLPSEFVTRTGATVATLVSARATLDEAGRPALVVAAPVDISDRKRAEASFVDLFSLSPVPMLIRKLDEPRILDSNEAFAAATGYGHDAIIGHGVEELGMFDNRAQRQQFEADIRTQRRIQNLEVHLKTVHGEVLDCLLSAQKIHAFGQTCVLLILQDISDRRRNEMQLFEAIETVMGDTSWFSRSVIEKLASLRSPPRAGARPAEMSDLTPREREVLGLISHGLADLDIALKLGLTRSTVRNHVATLYSKIGVHSRSAAIIWARERGINFAWPNTASPSFIQGSIARNKPGAPSGVIKNRRA